MHNILANEEKVYIKISFLNNITLEKINFEIFMLSIINQQLLDLQTVIGANWNNSDVFLQLSCFSKKVYLCMVSKALEAISYLYVNNFQWLLGAFYMIFKKGLHFDTSSGPEQKKS